MSNPIEAISIDAGDMTDDEVLAASGHMDEGVSPEGAIGIAVGGVLCPCCVDIPQLASEITRRAREIRARAH